MFKVESWTTSGSNYTGCTIRGYRGVNLPIINPVSGLLTAVITGVNSIVTALTGLVLFSSSMASGAEFSFIAIQPS